MGIGTAVNEYSDISTFTLYLVSGGISTFNSSVNIIVLQAVILIQVLKD